MNKMLDIQKSTPQIVTEIYQQERSIGGDFLFEYIGSSKELKPDEIALQMEELLLSQQVSKKMVRALFSILIEGIQNAKLHSEPTIHGENPCFILFGKKEDYFLTTGNVVPSEQQIKISHKIDLLNSFSEDEMKDHYLQVLTEGSMSKKGGAGLGLITLSTKSKNTLQYSFEKLDQTSLCFTLRTSLNLKAYEKNDRRGDA